METWITFLPSNLKFLPSFPMHRLPRFDTTVAAPATTWARGVSSCCALPPQVRRYAVLGAGFAGVSVAWHLLQYCNASLQINVDLYDDGGIGAGASGVSGGLLHPYSPKGKLIWKGIEGWSAALELLAVAETASNRVSSDIRNAGIEPDLLRKPIAWRRGIIRPAIMPKHTDDFMKYVKLSPNHESKIAGLSCIDGSTARGITPGLAIPCDDLALYIADGINVNPLPYLQALWMACELHASDVVDSCSKAVLKRKRVDSLSCFFDYDAVIICLGANVNVLPELSGKVPLKLCRGVVAHAELPPDKLDEYKIEGPSILAGTWIAVRGPGRVVVGATKDWNNSDTSTIVSSEVASASCKELFTKVAAYYPPIRHWNVQEVCAGVRAMPKRTINGKLPLVGCIDDIVKCTRDQDALKTSPHYWLLGGLGSRGLIYHGWLGKMVAEAVIKNCETSLPTELIRWKDDLEYGV